MGITSKSPMTAFQWDRGTVGIAGMTQRRRCQQSHQRLGAGFGRAIAV